MKLSHYDILQVSSKATLEVINAAYQHLKSNLADAAKEGDAEARNQLLFLDEAYSTLSVPEKRSAYDQSLLQVSPCTQFTQNISSSYETQSDFLGWWEGSKTTRVLIGIALFACVFGAYKYFGQRETQKLQAKQIEIQGEKELGSVKSESYRAENERILVQGVVQNQDKLIDKSYDIAAQEAERRRIELEYRANAGSQQLEMQRQRQEAQLQEQKWRQEQYEKNLQLKEAQAAADAPKRQLCNMYALNGNVRDARDAGCYKLNR